MQSSGAGFRAASMEVFTTPSSLEYRSLAYFSPSQSSYELYVQILRDLNRFVKA